MPPQKKNDVERTMTPDEFMVAMATIRNTNLGCPDDQQNEMIEQMESMLCALGYRSGVEIFRTLTQTLEG